MTSAESSLTSLRQAEQSVWVIHYACESWYGVKDRLAEISCIAMLRVSDKQAVVFSQVDSKSDGEANLLRRFYDHLRQHPDAKLVHWNMHSPDFGFEAIANRYRYVVGQEPSVSVSENRRFDLDSIISRLFGQEYADHPKLAHVAALNDFSPRLMRTGKEEAELFTAGNHGDIRRSCTEKIELIAYLLRRLLKNQLVTKNSSALVTFASRRLRAEDIIEELGLRIEYVRRQLLQRHGDRATLKVQDEYDFQDLLHALLRIFFNDIRPEEWTPSYGGASARIDFIIKDAKIAIELKHSRQSMNAKSVGEELLVDIQKYKTHPDVKTLFCLVLDREGRIQNPRGLEHDLSGLVETLRVVVKIIDR